MVVDKCRYATAAQMFFQQSFYSIPTRNMIDELNHSNYQMNTNV